MTVRRYVLIIQVPYQYTVFLSEAHCVRKVAMHLYEVLEVMSASIYTGLNLFNFIRKHFLKICL